MSRQDFNAKTGRAWGGAYSAPPHPAQSKAPPTSAQLSPGVLVSEARAGLGHESAVSDEEFSRSAKLAAVRALQLRAHLAKNDPSVFSAYVLRDERNGQPIHQAPLHRAWHELLSKHPRLLMWSHVEGGKALPVDTPIPTPTGFTTMGDLRDGDTVLAGDGRPCSVVQAHAVRYDRPCFLVRFDDGSSLVADAEHNWLAYSLDDLNARSKRQPRVVTTSEMRERLRRGRDFMWKVPVAGAAQHAEKRLPVPPYVLGAWLGDGHASCSRLTFHANDRAVWERCRDLVGSCDPVPDARNPDVLTATLGPATHSRSDDGLRAALRALGVLDNKHIPVEYLTASEAQRRALLAGLLDTDGCAVTSAGKKSRVEFSSSSAVLAAGVVQLTRSLGFKPRTATSESKLYGRVVGLRYRVTFTASEPVFLLERKQRLLRKDGARPKTRTVVAIDPVPSVPVRCITVDSSDRTYLAGKDYVVTHNTTQVAVGRTLWELGRDPSLRVCVVSNTTELAMKITRQIAQYIERSPELRHVFPNLKPTDDPALPWKAKALTIARTGMGSKDPSIQATGVHGNVLGSRIDLLILDDVLDYENTSTPGPREDVWRWVKSTLMSRLTDGARVWVIGNAWHPDDLMHRMEREPGFVAKRFPVLDAQGVCTWPERWSPERIRQARADLGPLEYARQLLCQARDDTSARFKREWVDGCLAVGQGKPWCETAEALADSLGLHVEGAESAEALWRLGGFPGQVIHGVDLAVQKHDAADKTVIFSILVHEDGLRQVLSIRSGRWAGPEIIAQVEDTFSRLGGTFVVENNAAQNYIVQFLQAGSTIPIMPFTTGRNKAHPEFGVEGLAAELAACKWLLPNEGGRMHDELSAWVQELLYYDPREHTGDRVMASWLAREGARRLGGTSNRKGGVSVRIF